MVEERHAAHLPWFVTEPGQTDALMLGMGVFLVLFMAAVGVVLFRILYMPAQMVPAEQKTKATFVATLCVLAMFHPGTFLLGRGRAGRDG
ncbi:hypothetical protein XH93_36900 [Bradyrhizobium sp. CCBAU 51753]|nr:hypothetical protein XH93_36900 [Bradyrhizobium sp. CCBAU 51753]